MKVLIILGLALSVSAFNQYRLANDELLSMTKDEITPGKEAVSAKTYIVNLDLPPMERWNNVFQHFNPEDFTVAIRTLIQEFLPSNLVLYILEVVASELDRYIPQPFADELRGISKNFRIGLGDLVLGNLVYDLSAFTHSIFPKACTSIVALDKMGRIIHGRNLDYLIGKKLKPLTMQVDYQKNGKTLFMATTYLGYIGVITGTKNGAFSVSGDQRNTGNIFENFLSALNGSWPTFMLQRMVLEDAKDYQEAVALLSRTPTIAPVYFIVGGAKPGEGAIIVRDQAHLRNITLMDNRWYILETNYDPWNAPPKFDDRRDAGIAAMNKVGRENMDPEELYKVLSVPPVFNTHTTYTTIMSAADPNVYRTMIRYDAPSD
ncbi:N-acylethanolamine-hydrolyzing acid amidase-like [Clavelina lepadiformis]|uniref:N-acylethanolamine-hydrolyzing acid amidase-like n=1 Tax=Clavelina lepadiformis TaxID=159417 RepID=UPI004041D9A9